MGEELGIRPAEPVEPISCPLGLMAHPLELAACPLDDIGIDQLESHGTESRLTKARPARWNGFSQLNREAARLVLRALSARTAPCYFLDAVCVVPAGVRITGFARLDVKR